MFMDIAAESSKLSAATIDEQSDADELALLRSVTARVRQRRGYGNRRKRRLNRKQNRDCK